MKNLSGVFLLVVSGALLFSGCAGLQARQELEAKRADLIRLEADAATLRSYGAAPELIAKADAAVVKARLELQALEKKVAADQLSQGAAAGQSILSVIAPLLGYLYPAAGGILALIGAMLGKLTSTSTPSTAPLPGKV